MLDQAVTTSTGFPVDTSEGEKHIYSCVISRVIDLPEMRGIYRKHYRKNAISLVMRCTHRLIGPGEWEEMDDPALEGFSICRNNRLIQLVVPGLMIEGGTADVQLTSAFNRGHAAVSNPALQLCNVGPGVGLLFESAELGLRRSKNGGYAFTVRETLNSQPRTAWQLVEWTYIGDHSLIDTL